MRELISVLLALPVAIFLIVSIIAIMYFLTPLIALVAIGAYVWLHNTDEIDNPDKFDKRVG